MKSAMKSLVLILLLCASVHSQATREAAWREFTSIEGGFSVSMPTDTQTRTLVTYTPRGSLYTHMVSSSDDELNSFSVSWTTYNDDRLARRPVEQLFDKVRDGLLIGTKGRLVSESPINLGGNPGRAITYESSDGSVHKMRFYVVGDRFYQVSTQTKPAVADHSAGERFHASFKLRPGRVL